MNPVRAKLRPSLARVAAFMILVGFGVAHASGDVKAGSEKARMCEACHGLDGVSKMPEAPNLAGQVQGYLVAQLSAFKAGQRRNEQMSVIVQALSPQEIENLAAYYSAIQVTVGKVPGQ